MILNRKIIENVPNVGLGAALRRWLDGGTPDQRRIWESYIKEMLNRDYDELPPMLTRIFGVMRQQGVGLDYEVFYQAMEVWDEGDKEIRANIARTIWGGRGGFRIGAGAKTVSPDGPKQPLGISRVSPDVAHIVGAIDGSKTEFVENAIRFYYNHLNNELD